MRLRRRASDTRATRTVLFVAVAACLTVVAAACSSPAEPAPTTAVEGTAASDTAVATTASGEVSTTEAGVTTTESMDDAQLIALGETLYQETAGGIGCKACHGTDARGEAGPNIIGKSADTIRVNLETNENMMFIILNDEEIEAIAAYLATLE